MTIHVTQADIENGDSYNSRLCPVALAIARATKCSRVMAAYGKVRIDGWSRQKVIVTLPCKVVEFMLMFDSLLSVEPFSFELPLPEKGRS